MRADEGAFEAEICDSLVASGGYDAVKVGNRQGAPTHFDPIRGIDTAALFAFIGATQADEWEQLKKLHGGDPNVAPPKLRSPAS